MGSPGRGGDPGLGGRSGGGSGPGWGGWSRAGWVSECSESETHSDLRESVRILECISRLFDLNFLPFLRILYEGDTIQGILLKCHKTL